MSKDMVYEDVPQLTRRVGDFVLANENNATILLGRDRNGPTSSGHGSLDSSTKGRGAGAILLVAGRKGSDPSISDDSATAYLSAKADPDDMAGTGNVGESSTAVPSVIVRADCVRIVPRQDFKVSAGKAYLIVSADGTVTIEGNVSLGKGAADRILKGDTFVTVVYAPHTHGTAVGPTGPPIGPVPDSVYSPTNKVK